MWTTSDLRWNSAFHIDGQGVFERQSTLDGEAGVKMASEPSFWAIAVPATAGLAGAFLGAWLSRWNEQRKQRLEFCSQQLRELYSPLLAIRTHIRTLSELRLRIDQTHQATTKWREPADIDELLRQQGRHPAQMVEAKQLVEFNTEQFRTVLLPQYERMLSVFQDKYWLADATTRQHYQALLQYVELWKRFLAKTIPDDVITTFDVRESQLQPFYENLEEQFDRLQRILQQADVSLKATKSKATEIGRPAKARAATGDGLSP